MKKFINFLCITIFISLLAGQAKAADDFISGSSGGDFLKVGAAGSQFLKIGVGARASGMAGAYGAVANDLSSVFWNPAGLADVKSVAGHFSFTQWFANFQHSFAAAALPMGDQFTLALSFVSFGSDRIEITTMSKPEGTGTFYTINDMAVGLSFAGYLTDQFSFGVTARYVANSFASLSSNGITFDIGTMYETGIQGIKLGFSMHNLGTEMQYQGQDLRTTTKIIDELNASQLEAEFITSAYNIPLIFRAGVAADIYRDDDNHLITSVDFITLSDVPEQFAIGAEYTWRDFVSVRGGYLIGQDQFGLSFGAGLKYTGGGFNGGIDYSMSPTSDIGIINRITINLGL